MARNMPHLPLHDGEINCASGRDAKLAGTFMEFRASSVRFQRVDYRDTEIFRQ